MARNVAIKILRTTRANLNTQAGSGNLLVGEPYLITDEGRIAVALTTSTYEEFVKASELPHVGTTAPASPSEGDLWVDTN